MKIISDPKCTQPCNEITMKYLITHDTYNTWSLFAACLCLTLSHLTPSDLQWSECERWFLNVWRKHSDPLMEERRTDLQHESKRTEGEINSSSGDFKDPEKRSKTETLFIIVLIDLQCSAVKHHESQTESDISRNTQRCSNLFLHLSMTE